MASANSPNKAAIFGYKPILVCGYSTVGGATVFPNVTPVEQMFQCEDEEGCIINRVSISMATEVGNTNSQMLFYIVTYDAGHDVWIQRCAEEMPGVTVSHSLKPGYIEFIFDGGILLPMSGKIGVARSKRDGDSDDFHWVLEGATFKIV